MGGVLLLVLMVAGYIVLAERHSDKLRIVRDPQTHQVRVEQGWYAPMGWATFQPTEAFTPVTLDPDIPLREGPCSQVSDCEARLFEAVAEQARRMLRRRERLREASALIAQAVKLSGEANVSERLELEGDEQYVRGLLKFEEAAADLLDASRHFRRAQAMGSRVFRDGQARWRQSRELLDVLRQSGVAIPGVEAGELDPEPDPLPLPRPNTAPPKGDDSPMAPDDPPGSPKGIRPPSSAPDEGPPSGAEPSPDMGPNTPETNPIPDAWSEL
ncbi:MAG: hypothetical protein AAFX99_04135 [Myxococcota bacterium]